MKIKIPFVGGSYQSRSINVDAQSSINCFVEMDNQSPRAPLALYGTPGTISRLKLPSSPVRGCIVGLDASYWVAGNKVYKVTTGFGYSEIGTIDTSVGAVSMSSSGQQIIIVDGIAGWIITLASDFFARITSGNFPNGVKMSAFQDGFFLVAGDNSGKFYINQSPYDGGVWDALDFASAEGSPDNTIGIFSDHREIWLFGSNSIEIWINTGDANFPFQRSGNTFIELGCAASSSIAKLDNSLFWLGSDDRGNGSVWRANGYTPTRISTHAIESAIAGYGVISDAIGMSYQQEGHLFYIITFPTAGVTWCYDVATQLWHQRAWWNTANASFERWRANCILFFNGNLLCGDYQNGNIYELSLEENTDAGGILKRVRATTCTEQLQDRMFYSWLQVDMETGTGVNVGQGTSPSLMLRYSNDGGHTWSNEKTSTIGNIGQYGHRAQYRRLGTGRNRVWEISMTDPVKFVVLGSIVEAQQGVS